MAGNNNNSNSLLQGFLIGGAIGAAAGILFAPKSGKELRSSIKGTGCDVLDGAKRFCSEFQTKAKAMIEGAKSGVQELRKGL